MRSTTTDRAAAGRSPSLLPPPFNQGTPAAAAIPDYVRKLGEMLASIMEPAPHCGNAWKSVRYGLVIDGAAIRRADRGGYLHALADKVKTYGI